MAKNSLVLRQAEVKVRRFLRFFRFTLPHETDYVNASSPTEDKHGWTWAILIGGMTDDSIYIHSLLHVVYLGGLRFYDFLYFSWWWSKLTKLFVKGNEVSEDA